MGGGGGGIRAAAPVESKSTRLAQLATRNSQQSQHPLCCVAPHAGGDPPCFYPARLLPCPTTALGLWWVLGRPNCVGAEIRGSDDVGVQQRAAGEGAFWRGLGAGGAGGGVRRLGWRGRRGRRGAACDEGREKAERGRRRLGREGEGSGKGRRGKAWRGQALKGRALKGKAGRKARRGRLGREGWGDLGAAVGSVGDSHSERGWTQGGGWLLGSRQPCVYVLTVTVTVTGCEWLLNVDLELPLLDGLDLGRRRGKGKLSRLG